MSTTTSAPSSRTHPQPKNAGRGKRTPNRSNYSGAFSALTTTSGESPFRVYPKVYSTVTFLVIAISSFGCSETQKLFDTEKSRKFTNIGRASLRKLIQLNQAGQLEDMAVPPGNRLEALNGDLKGFHSIRINGQWRIIFKWTDSGPAEVAIVDYH